MALQYKFSNEKQANKCLDEAYYILNTFMTTPKDEIDVDKVNSMASKWVFRWIEKKPFEEQLRDVSRLATMKGKE